MGNKHVNSTPCLLPRQYQGSQDAYGRCTARASLPFPMRRSYSEMFTTSCSWSLVTVDFKAVAHLVLFLLDHILPSKMSAPRS